MQEVMTEEYIKKCEEQSWERCNDKSVEMAHCLRRLGEIHYSMEQPEKEFEAEYGQSDSPMSLCKYILILASPFHWLQQNLQRPMEFYQEGYDLLRKAKGASAPETVKHKKLLQTIFKFYGLIWQIIRNFAALMCNFQGVNYGTAETENIVRMSRQHLPQSDGRVCDERSGKQSRTG